MSTFGLSQLNTLTLPQAAEIYARNGWRIFPISPNSKQPPLCAWADEATSDLARVRAWWTQWPDANIGWALGGGWAALDLDRKHEGEDGWASYLDLGGPANPSWPIQRTPGGGLHLLWWLGRQESELSNFARRGPRGGLDMRCSRGYILLTPSIVGGKRYLWAAGDRDPRAPVPDTLWQACLGYSRRAAERAPGAFPVPEVESLDRNEWNRRVDLLGADHARFLRGDGGVHGDDSRDAFQACLRAFSLGWSLEDMAAVGQDSYLAHFGGNPPHSATRPWEWCWRYTVQAAWREAKKDPAGGAGSGPFEEEVRHETDFKDSGTEAGVQAPSLYTLLRGRAERLPEGDFHSMEAWVGELVDSGLPPHAQEDLLGIAKASTGCTLAVLRGARDHAIAARRAARERVKLDGGEAAERACVDEVYVRRQAKLLDRRNGALISERAFLVDKAREFDGNVVEATEAWLTGQAARCEIVEDLVYDPAKPGGIVTDGRGSRLYNTYLPSTLMATGAGTEEDVRPWLSLLRALDLEEGEAAEGWLLDRMAWIVQHPGRKINHGVLMGGEQGIGKDSFLAPLIEALGEHNCTTIDALELASGFNSYLHATHLLLLNEIDFGDHRERRTVAERLKPLLAAPPKELMVNEKKLRPYAIPNRVQVMGMTNHRLCLHADTDDRRWLLLRPRAHGSSSTGRGCEQGGRHGSSATCARGMSVNSTRVPDHRGRHGCPRSWSPGATGWSIGCWRR